MVVFEGRELGCLITDISRGGFRIRLDRADTLPRDLTMVEIGKALAFVATVAWQKGAEAGLHLGEGTSIRGLVPSRLMAARQAWVRATGR